VHKQAVHKKSPMEAFAHFGTASGERKVAVMSRPSLMLSLSVVLRINANASHVL